MTKLVVACLGDSITEGSPHWDSRRRSGNPEGQWEHWVALAHPELELHNFGIWGERTDEIAARFDDAVQGADVLIVQGGINDLAGGIAPETAARNLHAMLERGRDRALRVAVCDVLPWNRGWPPHEAPIRDLNERIHAFGATLLPFHDTLEDPDRPGRMKKEWTHDDGDHPSVAGYQRLGELAFRLPDR